MEQYESLQPTKWECKYHVVFIPKCRRRTIYGALKQHLGPVFRTLTEQKESRSEQGHLMVEHVHMLIAIPPKDSVANVIGYIKGQGERILSRGNHAEDGKGVVWLPACDFTFFDNALFGTRRFRLEETECRLAYLREIGGTISTANSRLVFAKRDIETPMKVVFN